MFICLVFCPAVPNSLNARWSTAGRHFKKRDATMNEQQFNATIELEKLRQHRRICRKQQYQTSRLNKYREELMQLMQEGASFREMALWLRSQKRVRVSHTTVMRYMRKLSELKHL